MYQSLSGTKLIRPFAGLTTTWLPVVAPVMVVSPETAVVTPSNVTSVIDSTSPSISVSLLRTLTEVPAEDTTVPKSATVVGPSLTADTSTLTVAEL